MVTAVNVRVQNFDQFQRNNFDIIFDDNDKKY